MTTEMVDKLIKKEEQLSSLFKAASKLIAEFEGKTEEMTGQIRQCRDEQVLKYGKRACK